MNKNYLTTRLITTPISAAQTMKNKICYNCKKEKPLIGFVKYLSGYRGICKECHRNKEKKRRNKNIVEARKHTRQKYKENNLYEKRIRSQCLKYSYGITIEQYDKMLEQHNGVCAICGLPETRKRKSKTLRLCIDHNHQTNKIRGLLCSGCNTAIGRLKIDTKGIINLQNAIRYIKSFQ